MLSHEPSNDDCYTRVAVVQLDYQPASLIDRQSPLENPIYNREDRDPFLPENGHIPQALRHNISALQQRIRQVYVRELRQRLQIILRLCQSWKVRLVVFPEYSIPWECLEDLANSANNMVVVAGTHAVDQAAVREKVYEKLEGSSPRLGSNVCPVLYQRRLLALQPKLTLSSAEQFSTSPGESWDSVELPETIPGALGILICLDFLYRDSHQYIERVVPKLRDDCYLLAVPSLTPPRSVKSDFEAKLTEMSRRYHRPTLFANRTSGGGTSIYTDKKDLSRQSEFPAFAGRLDPGDEGVIVADIRLENVRPGNSTPYDNKPLILPFAAASFVYRCLPSEDEYAKWLETLDISTSRDKGAPITVAEGSRKVRESQELLERAAAMPQAKARQRRLHQLLHRSTNLTRIEEFAQHTREVIMPPEILPLPSLRKALALGASEAYRTWASSNDGLGLGSIADHFAGEGKRPDPSDQTTWTQEGQKTFEAIRRAVQEEDNDSCQEHQDANVRGKQSGTSTPTQVTRNKTEDTHIVPPVPPLSGVLQEKPYMHQQVKDATPDRGPSQRGRHRFSWWFPSMNTGILLGLVILLGLWMFWKPSSPLRNSIGMEFELIKPGEFAMGSEEGDDNEKPVHPQTIAKPFYLGKYEVTQEQWNQVMPPETQGGSRHPVGNISWKMAQQFIEKLTQREPGIVYRLPSEAEWEYAARAGSQGKYSFGNDDGKLPQYAVCNTSKEQNTQPVGSRKPNAWGLYDMNGNVWEWVNDQYKDYPNRPGPASLVTDNRVLRGGAQNSPPRDCRSAVRHSAAPDARSQYYGLRVLREVDGK